MSQSYSAATGALVAPMGPAQSAAEEAQMVNRMFIGSLRRSISVSQV